MKKEIHLTSFEKKVLDTIKKIPAGRIATYKEVARAVGKPRASRAVGNALHKNPWAPKVPCHRVVRSDGGLGGYGGGVKLKLKLLEEEGLTLRNKRVVGINKVLMRIK